MAKRLRIAILYNEPSVDHGEGRKYVSENGQIQNGPAILVPAARSKPSLAEPPARATGKPRRPLEQPQVDLSEVGVLEEMEDIRTALVSLGYKATVFNVDSDLFRLIDHLREEKPDLIFNLVECVDNESIQEMNVAGIYELLKIPYTGANPLALGTALDKPRVKELLSYHKINTPKSQVFRSPNKITLDEGLQFPLIVKPSGEDASVGITNESVVYNASELKKRVRYIFQEFDQAALVEQYIDGRELNVAIIGYKKPIVLPISEIDFPGFTENMHKIVSYEAKWMHGTIAYEGTTGVCPAILPAELELHIKEIALRCYEIVGCRDYARVDFRLTADGTPYVLEVNPNPDISDDAGFARSAKAHGFTFAEVVGKIVESAFERYQ